MDPLHNFLIFRQNTLLHPCLDILQILFPDRFEDTLEILLLPWYSSGYRENVMFCHDLRIDLYLQGWWFYDPCGPACVYPEHWISVSLVRNIAFPGYFPYPLYPDRVILHWIQGIDLFLLHSFIRYFMRGAIDMGIGPLKSFLTLYIDVWDGLKGNLCLDRSYTWAVWWCSRSFLSSVHDRDIRVLQLYHSTLRSSWTLCWTWTLKL